MTVARLYAELADWWPVMSAPDDYAQEAALYAKVLAGMARREVREVLELGSGGGNNASHLRERFDLTLTDLAPGMLDVSRRLNPDCAHVEGDMRTLRLERDFDAVLAHDAVMYLTTTDDLSAAIETAFVHLRPGGIALFVPDETTENFDARTEHGGHDADGRSLRYLEWTRPLNPDGRTFTVSFVFLLREGEGPVRVEYDEHTFAVFPRDTWLGLLADAGFEATALRHAYGEPGAEAHTELFVGIRPGGS